MTPVVKCQPKRGKSILKNRNSKLYASPSASNETSKSEAISSNNGPNLARKSSILERLKNIDGKLIRSE